MLIIKRRFEVRFRKRSGTFGFTWDATSVLLDESCARPTTQPQPLKSLVGLIQTLMGRLPSASQCDVEGHDKISGRYLKPWE